MVMDGTVLLAFAIVHFFRVLCVAFAVLPIFAFLLFIF